MRIKEILIANRGEIAGRITWGCRNLGIDGARRIAGLEPAMRSRRNVGLGEHSWRPSN